MSENFHIISLVYVMTQLFYRQIFSGFMQEDKLLCELFEANFKEHRYL